MPSASSSGVLAVRAASVMMLLVIAKGSLPGGASPATTYSADRGPLALGDVTSNLGRAYNLAVAAPDWRDRQ